MAANLGKVTQQRQQVRLEFNCNIVDLLLVSVCFNASLWKSVFFDPYYYCLIYYRHRIDICSTLICRRPFFYHFPYQEVVLSVCFF